MEFRHISHISEAITDKRMKIDPYCQRQNCSPICTFQRYIDCVDIARRYSARGRQTTVRWQKQVFVHTRLSRAYLALAIGFLVVSASKRVTDKLQSVLNAAARLTTRTQKYKRGLSRLMHDVLYWVTVP